MKQRLVRVDLDARTYAVYEERRRVCKWTILDEDPLLMPEEVEALRLDNLLFDAVSPEPEAA